MTSATILNEAFVFNFILSQIICLFILFVINGCLVLYQRLACWVKFTADDILKHMFLTFFQKSGIDIFIQIVATETICMKCRILVSVGKENTM